MLEGAALMAVMLKMAPYVIGMKVLGGVVDVAVHAAKARIGKEKIRG